MTHYTRTTCRLCDGAIKVLLPMHPIPIADAYTATKPDPVTTYPVDVYQCQACSHLQLADVINPELLFRNYHFRTAENAAMKQHLYQYHASVLDSFFTGFVVEIGSNDGTFLRMFQNNGSKVLGFDPSDAETEIPTVREFFNADTARDAVSKHGRADVIIANHVFAHSDDLHGMAEGVKQLLAPHGVFIMEVAYGVDMLERRLFDQIHHEHLSFHHVSPLIGFFRRHGLAVANAERNDCKGGSVRLLIGHEGYAVMSPALLSLLQYEASIDFDKAAAAMMQDLQNARQRLKPYASNPAFGAGPGATTLIGQLELTPEFLIDDNPRKHGLYSPWGMQIKAATDERATVLLSTRYAADIMRRHPGEWVYSI